MTGPSGTPPARVPDDQLDFDEELIYFYKGERFTGIGYADVPKHGLSEISYRDGLQDGPARDWYPSGRLKAESFFRENVLHGVSRDFREDGSLEAEKEHEFGILLRSSVMNEAGEIAESFVLSESSPNYAILQQYRNKLK
jgi:antitoxin component YwqK of YwqJK toxin-antitoxin module